MCLFGHIFIFSGTGSILQFLSGKGVILITPFPLVIKIQTQKVPSILSKLDRRTFLR